MLNKIIKYFKILKLKHKNKKLSRKLNAVTMLQISDVKLYNKYRRKTILSASNIREIIKK